MIIPEELRDLDLETYDAITSLVIPAKKGEIISIAALVEEEVTTFLIHHSSKSPRKIQNHAFGKKLKELKKIFLTLPDEAAATDHSSSFISALIAIRNLPAHTYGIGFKELHELYGRHPAAKNLLINCPNNIWPEVKMLKDTLTRLSK